MCRPGRNGISLIETLVVIAIIGVLIALTLAGVQKVRARAAVARCQNNLRQIGIGLSNYHAAHGCLPPGVTLKDEPGTFRHMSWQTRLLPYIEQDAVWQQAVDGAKSQPSNFTASPHPIATVIPTYGCPADSRTAQPAFARKQLNVGLGSYLGIAGTRHSRENGSLFRDSRVTFTDITDGTSNTLLVGERPPSPDMWVGWWYAGYGTDSAGTADTVLGVTERATTSGYLDMPDCGPGSTKYQPGRLDNTCDMMHYWSLHDGGAHFLLADGSVRFLGYSADPLMPALATRAGGEGVSVPD